MIHETTPDRNAYWLHCWCCNYEANLHALKVSPQIVHQDFKLGANMTKNRLLIIGLFAAVFLFIPSQSKAQSGCAPFSKCIQELNQVNEGMYLKHCEANPWATETACELDWMLFGKEVECDIECMYYEYFGGDSFETGTADQFDPWDRYMAPILGGGNESPSPF